MNRSTILWIESKRAEGSSFVPGLRKKGADVRVVDTGSAAIAIIASLDPDLIVLNAASMGSSGSRICHTLNEKVSNVPIVLINDADHPAPADVRATVVLVLPFTLRKLVNRINPLLPGESANLLHKGPIRLDLERKRVRCMGREARLTPRLAQLLQILITNAGAVVERNKIIHEVWKTDYTGDTRTLDVHISWLRQALEEDPRHPRFLKTLRGVGYRLDI